MYGVGVVVVGGGGGGVRFLEDESEKASAYAMAGVGRGCVGCGQDGEEGRRRKRLLARLEVGTACDMRRSR